MRALPLFHQVIQAMLGTQGRQALGKISIFLCAGLFYLALNDVRISVAASSV